MKCSWAWLHVDLNCLFCLSMEVPEDTRANRKSARKMHFKNKGVKCVTPSACKVFVGNISYRVSPVMK